MDEICATTTEAGLTGEVGFAGASRGSEPARVAVGGLGVGATSPLRALTARELQVLAYVGQGWSTKEIAAVLNVSVKTVGRHKTNLMAKLDIHDRVQLTLCAVREGLVSPWSGKGAG